MTFGGARVFLDYHNSLNYQFPSAPVKRTRWRSVSLDRRPAGWKLQNDVGAHDRQRQLILTEIRSPGELVKTHEVVAPFDPTEEDFKLREAEADLAESNNR